MLTLAQGFLLPFDDILLWDQGSIVAPSGLLATVVAGPQVNLSWVIAGITSEDHYSIERRDVTAGGSFAEIATVGANISTYAGDVGPFTTRHGYAWRITVVGGPSDGQHSNVALALGGSTGIPSARLTALDEEFSRA